MSTCKDCNHDCHCKEGKHIDEYLDYCPCGNCNCKEDKRTYTNIKDHGTDMSYENEEKNGQ